MSSSHTPLFLSRFEPEWRSVLSVLDEEIEQDSESQASSLTDDSNISVVTDSVLDDEEEIEQDGPMLFSVASSPPCAEMMDSVTDSISVPFTTSVQDSDDSGSVTHGSSFQSSDADFASPKKMAVNSPSLTAPRLPISVFDPGGTNFLIAEGRLWFYQISNATVRIALRYFSHISLTDSNYAIPIQELVEIYILNFHTQLAPIDYGEVKIVSVLAYFSHPIVVDALFVSGYHLKSICVPRNDAPALSFCSKFVEVRTAWKLFAEMSTRLDASDFFLALVVGTTMIHVFIVAGFFEQEKPGCLQFKLWDPGTNVVSLAYLVTQMNEKEFFSYDALQLGSIRLLITMVVLGFPQLLDFLIHNLYINLKTFFDAQKLSAIFPLGYQVPLSYMIFMPPPHYYNIATLVGDYLFRTSCFVKPHDCNLASVIEIFMNLAGRKQAFGNLSDLAALVCTTSAMQGIYQVTIVSVVDDWNSMCFLRYCIESACTSLVFGEYPADGSLKEHSCVTITQFFLPYYAVSCDYHLNYHQGLPFCKTDAYDMGMVLLFVIVSTSSGTNLSTLILNKTGGANRTITQLHATHQTLSSSQGSWQKLYKFTEESACHLDWELRSHSQLCISNSMVINLPVVSNWHTIYESKWPYIVAAPTYCNEVDVFSNSSIKTSQVVIIGFDVIPPNNDFLLLPVRNCHTLTLGLLTSSCAQFQKWDPGEHFQMSKVPWSLQSKQWDPGRLIHREIFYNLQDKVDFDGVGNDMIMRLVK